MGNALEMALVATPSLCIWRILFTSSHVSLARPCSSPLLWYERPLRSMSRVLSPCVPKNKWSGFTHGGLSQWWQTHCSGLIPVCMNQAARWASQNDPANPRIPYPWLFFAPVHTQQPLSSILTRAKKDSIARSMVKCLCFPQRMDYYVSRVMYCQREMR